MLFAAKQTYDQKIENCLSVGGASSGRLDQSRDRTGDCQPSLEESRRRDHGLRRPLLSVKLWYRSHFLEAPSIPESGPSGQVRPSHGSPSDSSGVCVCVDVASSGAAAGSANSVPDSPVSTQCGETGTVPFGDGGSASQQQPAVEPASVTVNNVAGGPQGSQQGNVCTRWCHGVVSRWRSFASSKFRRAKIAFELQPDRVQRIIQINRRFNKTGALIYGPLAFVSGLLIATHSPLRWVCILPAVWFVGMVLSHLIFDRCVLNEITVRLGKLKRGGRAKAEIYQRTAGYTRKSLPAGRSIPVEGGLLTRIYDN